MSNRHHPPEVNLNLNVRGLSMSATLRIQERSTALKAEGRRVFRMGLGQSPFPVPESVVLALKSNAHQKDYLPVKGLPALREAVANYHRRTQHVTCTGNDVLIGPGSKELMFILQIVYYGDLVIPSPSWVSYAPQAQIIGRQVRWVPTRPENGWRLTPGELESICHDDPNRPRIVILNYPNNPVGTTYKKEDLKEIARIARKHRVLFLSDEIYGELHHKGQHVSIARYYPEGSIISSGLSKWCGAGGWRLGTFTFPSELRWLLDGMAVVASETFTSTSAPIQYAAVRAFEGSMAIEKYLRQSRRILRALGRMIYHRLTEMGVALEQPQGAFYVFPDFSPLAEKLRARGIMDSEQLCERLLEETGVACLPGTVFGRPREELTVRMAYVDFDGARALSALEGVTDDGPLEDSFLKEYCHSIVAALDAIAKWLKNV